MKILDWIITQLCKWQVNRLRKLLSCREFDTGLVNRHGYLECPLCGKEYK